MAITRVKTSSILQNFPKERSMLAGNDGDTGAYESIATVSLTGTQSSVEFTNIPQTFSHLQLRIFAKSQRSDAAYTDLTIQINGVTASTYRTHALYGNGSSAGSFTLSDSNFFFGRVGASGSNGTWGALIIDVLDYTSVDKYKTLRSLGGADANGSGEIYLNSGFNSTNTNAITSIKLQSYTVPAALTGFVANSHFALYGIR